MQTNSPILLSPSSPTSKFVFEGEEEVTTSLISSPPSPASSSENSPVPFIHMNLGNGRKDAEKLLNLASEGSYLVRTSSNNHNYAISLKMNNRVEHILVESVLTNIGQQVTVNNEKFFSNLKDLLDFYHIENIYQNHKLCTILLPQKNKEITKVISAVFINKFCEALESFNDEGIEDLANSLGLLENLRKFQVSFQGSNLNKRELGKWLLESWVLIHEDHPSSDLFEKSICEFKDGQKLWKKLKPFFSPM